MALKDSSGFCTNRSTGNPIHTELILIQSKWANEEEVWLFGSALFKTSQLIFK